MDKLTLEYQVELVEVTVLQKNSITTKGGNKKYNRFSLKDNAYASPNGTSGRG
jgi:hypothetical protein